MLKYKFYVIKYLLIKNNYIYLHYHYIVTIKYHFND